MNGIRLSNKRRMPGWKPKENGMLQKNKRCKNIKRNGIRLSREKCRIRSMPKINGKFRRQLRLMNIGEINRLGMIRSKTRYRDLRMMEMIRCTKRSHIRNQSI
jgi:hypothetical protein